MTETPPPTPFLNRLLSLHWPLWAFYLLQQGGNTYLDNNWSIRSVKATESIQFLPLFVHSWTCKILLTSIFWNKCIRFWFPTYFCFFFLFWASRSNKWMPFVSIEVVDKLATRSSDRFNKHYLALEFCVFGSWPGGGLRAVWLMSVTSAQPVVTVTLLTRRVWNGMGSELNSYLIDKSVFSYSTHLRQEKKKKKFSSSSFLFFFLQ